MVIFKKLTIFLTICTLSELSARNTLHEGRTFSMEWRYGGAHVCHLVCSWDPLTLSGNLAGWHRTPSDSTQAELQQPLLQCRLTRFDLGQWGIFAECKKGFRDFKRSKMSFPCRLAGVIFSKGEDLRHPRGGQSRTASPLCQEEIVEVVRAFGHASQTPPWGGALDMFIQEEIP